MYPRVFTAFLVIAIIALRFATFSHAQDKSIWPDKPKNLQVLPKDWPGSRLRAPMEGFCNALGVNCSHCHVGEEGEPLDTYDFASDENPNKDIAREMMRMLKSINEHLDKNDFSEEDRVNMWCHTCHRGRPRPTTIKEELALVHKAKGVDSAIAHYAVLRENFYGKGTFNFGESALNNFGYYLLQNEDPTGAIKVFQMNTELYPESANAWDSFAEAFMISGDMKSAEKYYLKSLELNPENDNAKKMLNKIKDGE